jgi:hypothetical protein
VLRLSSLGWTDFYATPPKIEDDVETTIMFAYLESYRSASMMK